MQQWEITFESFHQLKIHQLNGLFSLFVVVRQVHLDSGNWVNSWRVQHHWNNSESAILGLNVAWLTHVIPCQSVLYVQIDIKHVVTFVLFDDLLECLVLSANLVHILWVDPHLCKVDQDTPAPLLYFCIALTVLDLNFDESARVEEGHNVFRKCDDFADLTIYFVKLSGQLFLVFKQWFIRHFKAWEFFEFIGEFSFDFREHSFVLELVETLHDNVFRTEIFNAHHV